MVNFLMEKVRSFFVPYLPSESDLFDQMLPTVNEAISNDSYFEVIDRELKELTSVLDEQFKSIEEKANRNFQWFLGLHSLFIANIAFLTASEPWLQYLQEISDDSKFFVWFGIGVLFDLLALLMIVWPLWVHTYYSVRKEAIFPVSNTQAIGDNRVYKGLVLIHKWTIAEYNRNVLKYRARNTRLAQIFLLFLAIFFAVAVMKIDLGIPLSNKEGNNAADFKSSTP
jgi:hypothetical protein